MLDLAGFERFFAAVHRYPPFPWQRALAERVLNGQRSWPEGIDIPTGLGKTAVLDVAVYALAAEAHLPATQRQAPTRTAFVVDRRVVVDQAYVHAVRVRDALSAAMTGAPAVVSIVADRLAGLSGDGNPLEVVRMRGGTTWDWRWLANPAQPAILVATVDQFGSRLLFRGYGVGARQRSIDAALVGTDCLLLLDEAHLAQPLIETAASAAAYEATSALQLEPVRRRRTVLLSGTLPGAITDVQGLDDDAQASDEARTRLEGRKPTALLDLAWLRREKIGAHEAFAQALARLADAEVTDGRRVLVVVNTVATARAVFAALKTLPASARGLLIGRARGYERRRIAVTWLPLLAAGYRPESEPATVTVATQTVEVGADLDIDVLISEAAPIDAILQRLGRLNRRGRSDDARAVVVHAAFRHVDDPVYGDASGRTWRWLTARCEPAAAGKAAEVRIEWDAAETIDFQPGGLGELVPREERRLLVAEPALAPVLLRPHLDRWARTDPEPVPDQPVAPFLHGIQRGAPEVTVVWRAGLPRSPVQETTAVWEAEMASAPIQSEEQIAVPLYALRGLLTGSPPAHVSDLEGGTASAQDQTGPVGGLVLAFIVNGEDLLPVTKPWRIPPGALVLVPTELGGHDAWGWTGQPATECSDWARDISDLAALESRTLRLRLRAGVLESVTGRSGWEKPVGRAQTAVAAADPEALERSVRALLDRIAEAPDTGDAKGLDSRHEVYGDDLRRLVDSLQAVGAWDLGGQARTGTGVVTALRDEDGELRWLVLTATPPSAVATSATDDDDVSTSSGKRVALEVHLRDVGGLAAQVAENVGLPKKVASTVELAGLAHDLGKADPRFQALLQGDQRLVDPQRLLAKSGMAFRSPAARAAAARANWPRGLRHEAISGALVRAHAASHPERYAGVDLDLLLHLIEAHHGRARPVFPAVGDPDPQHVAVGIPGDDSVLRATGPSSPDLLLAERFERLCRRYGYWGLALLEAIVRLADIERSRTPSEVIADA